MASTNIDVTEEIKIIQTEKRGEDVRDAIKPYVHKMIIGNPYYLSNFTEEELERIKEEGIHDDWS